MGLNILFLFIFLALGLTVIKELRMSYLHQVASHIQSSSVNLYIRYISYAFTIALLAAIYKYSKTMFQQKDVKIGFDLLVCTTVIWIASSELINWMDIVKPDQSYKLGLSILWGVSALCIIVIGIWKKKKHLRREGVTPHVTVKAS